MQHALVNQNRPALDYGFGPPSDGATAIGVVTGIVVEVVGQGRFALRIPDRDIGIRPCREHTLAREIVNACRRRCCPFDKLPEPLFLAAGFGTADERIEQQRQPHFKARHAIGNLLEGRGGAETELAGFVHPVGGMVRRDHLEIAQFKRLPERGLIRMIALRRGADHARSVIARKQQIVGSLEKIVRASLCEDLHTTPSRQPDHLCTLGGRDVEYHDRLVNEFRESDHTVDRLDLGGARMTDSVIFRRDVSTRNKSLAHPFQ